MEIRSLGSVRYEEARTLQESALVRVARGESPECLLLLEHPSVLTLGPRTKDSDISSTDFHAPHPQNGFSDIPIVRVDRGGGATYHGPGQLIIYPVFSLRERRLGVREFVSRGLQVLSRVALQCGVVAEPALNPAGLWVGSNTSQPKKLAAVGLRISQGVTNHGFAFNVSPDLSIFNGFIACSLAGMSPTSILAEGGYPRDVNSIKRLVAAGFNDEFSV